MKKAKKSKNNVVFLMALILAGCVLITAMLDSGLFAKFLTGYTVDDPAETAEFRVDVTRIEPVSADYTNLFADTNSDFEITMTCRSEVAVTADVVVTLDVERFAADKDYLKDITLEKLQRWLTFKVGSNAADTEVLSADGKYFIAVFKNAQVFGPSDAELSETVKLRMTMEQEFFEDLIGDGYEGATIQTDPDNRVYYPGNGRTSGEELFYPSLSDDVYYGHGLDYSNDVISIEDGEIPFEVRVNLTQVD
ncbi:MAG: hypothetical protein ILO53_03245 [Clostridia bacterium]|nr:hypothetical protein [Clostridia bacterium]